MSRYGSRVSGKLAKILGIKGQTSDHANQNPISPYGYVEEEPTTKEFLADHCPTADSIREYVASLFPFWSWIFHYNVTWLMGDLVAGITVGFVVVPQGMAYALLAGLTAEYGLYTSFVGFLLYWAFATSKDITIGTVAVMSTIVGNIVNRVQDEYPDLAAEEIARSLALISGVVLLFIGLTRLGFIVEFIPLVAIASFMTGAAISIAVGQVPTMLGLRDVKTREATYLVFINTLKALPKTRLDAAMGLSALAFLYIIRVFCNIMSRKQPRHNKTWFFISTLRMVFVICLYILISWLANRGIANPKEAKFKILGDVPSGFKHVGAPRMDTRILRAIASDIPTTILVLIIEHVAISKSFGRINNYVINPSQELVAVGFTNIFGPFLGAYPATGSFSRTAIKSKAGVRTPLAGIFTAVIVLLALYALTSVFYYIPSSSLAALIIHAVLDLITPPKTVYQFWKTSPLEVFIFFAGVIVAIFTSIETGIYVTVGCAAALLLWQVSRTRGSFLGATKVIERRIQSFSSPVGEKSPDSDVTREVFAPFDRVDGCNPAAELHSPYPGVFIYRFSGGFNYANSSLHFDSLALRISRETRRTKAAKYEKLGDRPWNDPGPRRGQLLDGNDTRPLLRAVILDFSPVSFMDTTSAQALVDLHRQFARHAAPETVEWYFAHINSRWIKRAIVANGFGYATEEQDATLNVTLNIARAAEAAAPDRSSSPRKQDLESADIEITAVDPSTGEKGYSEVTSLYGINRPFFHADIATAVSSAVASARRKDAQAE